MDDHQLPATAIPKIGVLQFSMRSLLLVIFLTCIWLAWRYGGERPAPPNKLVNQFVVGEEVYLYPQRSNGGYRILIGQKYGSPYTVEEVGDDYIRLKEQGSETLLPIAEVRAVVRYESGKQTTPVVQSTHDAKEASLSIED